MMFIALQSCSSRLHPEITTTNSVEGGNCKKPYELTVGCSKFSLANLSVTYKSRTFKMSSTEDGKVIYIDNAFAAEMGNALISGYSLGIIDPLTASLNEDISAIKKGLASEGVNTLELLPLYVKLFGFQKNLHGYYLVLDGNGYEILEKYIKAAVEQKPSSNLK
ncbi:MAG: hypothetical protein AB8B92_10850 [Gammaproteobacteria bacterium]